MTRISLCFMAIAETLETLEQLTQSFANKQDEILERLENSYERSLDENDPLYQVVNFYLALSRQTSESPSALFRRAMHIFNQYASESERFRQRIDIQVAKDKKSPEIAVYEMGVFFARLVVDGWKIFPPYITRFSRNFYQVLRHAQTTSTYRKKGFADRHQTEREVIEEALLILLEFIPQTDTETSQIQAMMERAKQRAQQIQNDSPEQAKADFLKAWDAVSQSVQRS